MLTRLYVDNFLCLVNFELPLGERNVLIGANGSGKTSVLEVLRRIRALISRSEQLEDVFSNPGSFTEPKPKRSAF